MTARLPGQAIWATLQPPGVITFKRIHCKIILIRTLIVWMDGDSPVVGAGHELFFGLGVPTAAVQHGRVALEARGAQP